MKTVGIREARQNLSALLEEVRKGREITITDWGKPVASLVPLLRRAARPFTSLAAFRRRMPHLDSPLSQTIIRERDESRY